MPTEQYTTDLTEKRPIRYTPLLLTLLTLYICIPFFFSIDFVFPVGSIAIFTAIGVTLWTINCKKNFFIGFVVLSLIAMLTDFFGTLNQVLEIIVFGSIWAWAMVVLVVRIAHAKDVTADTIRGGIAIYFLAAICWGMLYQLMYILNNAAFSFSADIADQAAALFYFSITTLTTLGYGDVTPRSQPALIASNLEALTGQIFIAVFVARLVALQVSNNVKKK